VRGEKGRKGEKEKGSRGERAKGRRGEWAIGRKVNPEKRISAFQGLRFYLSLI